MIEASCHCGAVVLGVPELPSSVFECNCSICRKLGVLWAYYAVRDVRPPATDSTLAYVWGPRRLAFHTCRTCGCTTHWAPIHDKPTKMGVNARLIEGLHKSNTAVQRLDGAGTGHFWS